MCQGCRGQEQDHRSITDTVCLDDTVTFSDNPRKAILITHAVKMFIALADEAQF